MDARFSRPMEAWSGCSPAEQVTTDSCVISSPRVDKILKKRDRSRSNTRQAAGVLYPDLSGVMRTLGLTGGIKLRGSANLRRCTAISEETLLKLI